MELSRPTAGHRLPAPVLRLLDALAEHHPETAQHALRVAARAEELAHFGRPRDRGFREAAGLVGWLHDLGKLVVPRSILNKPGPLDASEWQVVQTASACGESLLRPFFPPGNRLIEAIRNEHERWDGGGYPDRLYGEEIPELARLVLVADTLDAVSHHAPYRLAQSEAHAVATLRAGAGTQFDPRWVELAGRLWGGAQLAEIEGQPAAPRLHSHRHLLVDRPDDDALGARRAA